MKMRNLRKKVKISYQEVDEPPFDEYLYCDNCNDFVYEFCSIHGPLLVIPDNKPGKKSKKPSPVPLAAMTIPQVFLHLAPSTIPGAGIGVFSTLTLPRGVQFGPYRGQKTYEATSDYCWQISDSEKRPVHVVDAADANKSNWMRYVNCARHWREQNLLAYQYQGQIYYRTIKIIPRFSKLLVFYGSEFAHYLRIDLRQYNASNGHFLIKSESDKKIKEVHTLHNDRTGILSEESCVMEIKENAIINENSTIVEDCVDEIYNKVQCNTKEFDPQPFDDENKHVTSIKFICDECGYATHQKNLLVTHIHSSVIKCDKCNFKTKVHSYMKKHLMLHCISRKCVCEICGYRFPTEHDLKRHRKSHFREVALKKVGLVKNKIECPICKNVYNRTYTMKKHLETHKGVTPFKCRICSAEFKFKLSLTYHLKSHVTESYTK